MLWYTNFQAKHLVHKQTDKAILELEVRGDVIAECHSMTLWCHVHCMPCAHHQLLVMGSEGPS